MAFPPEQLSRILVAVDRHPALPNGRWEWIDLGIADMLPAVERLTAARPEYAPHIRLVLFALEEARGNILRHAGGAEKGMWIARGAASLPDDGSVNFLLLDSGPGFEIDGVLPPYPDVVCGRSLPFRRTLDGVLNCTIDGPHVLSFHFEPDEPVCELASPENLPTSGLGLSIIVKAVTSVSYLHGIAGWNALWMHLTPPRAKSDEGGEE